MWQFFYPRAIWRESKYGVSLKVTQSVAEASNGGVLYYFCHIHSKMSGKIQIMNTDGSGKYTNIKAEKELYPVGTISAFDEICGTVGISEYATGQSLGCEAVFLSGTIDSPFERCLNALDCKMSRTMRVLGHDVHTSAIATFMQQMIPHHHNAIGMAKLLLKQVASASLGCALEGCGADNPDYVAGEAGGVTDDGELSNILWGIINQQTYQIHQFYGYLGGDVIYQTAMHNGSALGAESLGSHCESTLGATSLEIEGVAFAPGKGPDVAGCIPTANTYCATINIHAGPTGLYMFEGIEGVSPTIEVTLGETLSFDQRHVSNWFHPLGFAYEPDGAHGSTWGGAELPEVEGAGELQYYIDGVVPTCDDAGDTGLDCYEPEVRLLAWRSEPKTTTHAPRPTSRPPGTGAPVPSSNTRLSAPAATLSTGSSSTLARSGASPSTASRSRPLRLWRICPMAVCSTTSATSTPR